MTNRAANYGGILLALLGLWLMRMPEAHDKPMPVHNEYRVAERVGGCMEILKVCRAKVRSTRIGENHELARTATR
jgi:hypothetical protein